MGTLAADTRIADRYVLNRKLGEGAMAEVWTARDERDGTIVAIKIPKHAESNEDDYLERFRREGLSIRGVQHQNVIRVFAYGDGPPAHLALELIEGPTLEEWLEAQKAPVSIDLAIEIVQQLLSALTAAHTAGVVHRDVKPSNVLLDGAPGKGGRAVLTDFGIARITKATDPSLLKTITRGHFVGTPAYVAPEQVESSKVDARADLYAVGVLLFELLTGQLPFDADNVFGQLAQRLAETPRPPSSIRKDIPVGLDRVVQRSMARAPEARFKTARDFSQALAESLGRKGRFIFVVGGEEQNFPGQEVFGIGRKEENQLRLPDQAVSGKQVQVVRTQLGYSLRVLPSLNETLLNGTPLLPGQEQSLRIGDELSMGDTVLYVAELPEE